MPWIIDRDLEPDTRFPEGSLCNAKGVAGPKGYTGDGSELTVPFRLLTDDHDVLYEGRTSHVGFAPLDDFGLPNAGCTIIEYRNARGDWEAL